MSDAGPKKFLLNERHFEGKVARRVFVTLWTVYAPFRKQALGLLVLCLFGRTLVLANANVIGWWVDTLLLKAPPNPTLIVLILVMTSFLGFACIAWFWRAFARIGIMAVGTLHDEAVIRTSRSPMAFLDATPIGRIVARYSSDYANLLRAAGAPAGDLVGQGIDLVVMSTLILYASPFYAPMIALAIGLNALSFKRNRSSLTRERRALAAVRGPAYAHFAETVQGYSPIKLYSKQERFHHRFLQFLDDLNRQKAQSAILHNVYTLKMNSISAFLFLGTALTGLALIHWRITSLGDLGIALTFVTMITQTLQRFFDVVVMFEEALTGAERLDDYIHQPLEPGHSLPAYCQLYGTNAQHRPRPDWLIPLHDQPGLDINIENLSFRYHSADGFLDNPRSSPWILHNFNLTVQAGESIGIIGRTGAGKSSLVQSLLHLYPFDEGNIWLGGRLVRPYPDSNQLSIEEMRQLIGYIPQNPTIFRGTLRENLSREGDVSPQTLISALWRVGLGPWLEQCTSDPLEYQLDEKGGNLSAGQKQLICLARLLLGDYPVIILDEATSCIDPSAEEQIMTTLNREFRKKTVIIIAHRLTTVQRCHRVIQMANGKIIDEGEPYAILRKWGFDALRETSDITR